MGYFGSPSYLTRLFEMIGEVCQFSGGPRQLRYGEQVLTLGASNLLVPGDDCIYVAPSLIAHFIDGHRYRPPDEFIAAVVKYPDTRSIEHKRLLLAKGGRVLQVPSWRTPRRWRTDYVGG